MKKYSNKQRLDALNGAFNDSLSVRNNTVFTITTQHFNAENMEDAADYIIHYKRFLKEYGYTDLVKFHFDNSNLTRKRKEVWFKENRKLTKKEERPEIEKDKLYEKKMEELNEKFAQKYAEDMFDEMFELDEKNKTIKPRKLTVE